MHHYQAFSFLLETGYHQNVAFLQLLYFKAGLAGTNSTGNRRKMFCSHQSFAAFDWPVASESGVVHQCFKKDVKKELNMIY